MDPIQRPRMLAIALTAAVAIGVLLGNSTVAAIDPAHYRGAGPSSREFVAAAASGQPEMPYYGRPLAYSDPAAVRAALCPGCDGPLVVAGSYAASVPYFGSREERAAIEASERRAIDAGYFARERSRESRQSHTGMGGPLTDEADELVAEHEAAEIHAEPDDGKPAPTV